MRVTAAAAAVSAIISLGTLAVVGTSSATGVVSATPATTTPAISNGVVYAITKVGGITLVGGSFTAAASPGGTSVARNKLLAYDSATGALLPGFAAGLDGDVYDLEPGPSAGTVYVAGKFSTAGGITSRRVALLNASTGQAVPGFRSPSFNGVVRGIRLAGSRLLVGGSFTTAGTQSRQGLASLSATTGAVDDYLRVALTERHNQFTGGAIGALGPQAMDISPDGSQLAVIGNFRRADGLPRVQAVVIDLAATSATVRDWRTTAFDPPCYNGSYDTYMRDVDYAPDGSYFVIGTTGGGVIGSACDAVTRWESSSTGTNLAPTWINSSGGDSILSVLAEQDAVYAGGHQRWMNNPLGVDNARSGAVPRAGLVALSPVTGLPLAWNPGRNPRGQGAYALYADAAGLLVGSDTDWVGNYAFKRPKLILFPEPGQQLTSDTLPTLPAEVYVGTDSGLSSGSFDGASAGALHPTDSLGMDFSRIRGAFVAGGRLFYATTDAMLYVRESTGAGFGPARAVDPYHDPAWRNVSTGSGTSTYDGATPAFYSQLPSLTSLTYAGERIYYTRSGRSALYSRTFNVDSGIVGHDETVIEASGWVTAQGLFATEGTLWRPLTATSAAAYPISGTTLGAPTTVATGVDWRGRAVFLSTPPPAVAGPAHRASAEATYAGISGQVTIPAAAHPGDLLLLATYASSSNPGMSAPAGWQSAGTAINGALTAQLWWRLAGAGDPGTPVALASTKSVLATATISAYSGVSASGPIHEIASANGNGTATTPAIASAVGERVIEVRGGRASQPPAWSLPTGSEQRAAVTAGTGAPYVFGVVSDYSAQGSTAGATGAGTGSPRGTTISWAISIRE